MRLITTGRRERKRDADPYQDLASGIIIRAAEDYRSARRRNSTRAMRELEQFFKSAWCDFLVGDMDGTYILRKLREEE